MSTNMEKHMRVIAGYKLSNEIPTRLSLKLTELPVGQTIASIKTADYLERQGILKDTIMQCPYTYFTLDGICFMLHGPGLAYQERMCTNSYARFYNPLGLALGKYVFHTGEGHNVNNTLFVVEGVTDALALWQAGYESIALLGTAITDERAEIVMKLKGDRRVLFIPDNDTAGYTFLASISSYLVLWGAGIRYLPNLHKDVCDMPFAMRKQWIMGAQ